MKGPHAAAVGLAVGAIAAAAAFASLQHAPPGESSPAPVIVAQADPRIASLQAQLAALESRATAGDARAAELERRLADGERQLVNFQVFIARQPEAHGAPGAQAADSGVAPGDEARAQLVRRAVPTLRAGDGRASVEQALGPPDQVDADADGGTTLRYFHAGAWVRLDRDGRMTEGQFVGRPWSDEIDANGNFLGLFTDAPWYRPARWQLDGVEVGMTWQEVLARLGPADESLFEADGQTCLVYRRRGYVVRLDDQPEYRVEAFLIGRTRLFQDANGNVR